jgi:hypothetical protein
MLKHSYSSIKDFTGCARRFQQVRILRRFKSSSTDATMYGERVHKAFELYLLHDTPLPDDLQHHRPLLGVIKRMPGQLFCEMKLGIRADFTPCEFYADDVWFRGVPDVLVLNLDKKVARIVDFKTGKSARFADVSQLELMAAMVMIHHPAIEKVYGMLSFVVANAATTAEYTREGLPEMLSKWAGLAEDIGRAQAADVWNPTPSGLCRFCPVTPDVCEYR